jgi:hypothetical protein
MEVTPMNAPARRRSKLTYQETVQTVLDKIERIEEGQDASNRKLDALHTAIYDPDEGVYARIKAGAATAEKMVIEFEQRQGMLVTKLTEQLKHAEKTAAESGAKMEKLDDAVVKVDELMRWKTSVDRIITWLVVAVATGVGGLLAKLLYEWLSTHVKIA